jgi:L-threonylcarbamoyladenylate synthase
MKTIPIDELDDSHHLEAIAKVLSAGGLVCLPCNSSYRIVADLTSEGAVTRLLQSKRRTRKAPSLVFVDDLAMLSRVTDQLDPVADKLAARLWPGPLTILVDAHPDLPEKVTKQLCKANGKLGVRVPDDSLLRQVIQKFGRPLLASSANKEKKAGAGSPAQVRKNFVSRIDLFVDAGDLPPSASSTVVDVSDGKVVITRPGAVSKEQIEQG